MAKLPPAFRTIAQGRELPAAFAEVFPFAAGWVQATGEVEDLEVKVAGPAANVRRAFRGRFTLVQLSGRLGGPYGVVVSRAHGDGIEIVAGALLRARSLEVSAVCLGDGGEVLTAGAPAAVTLVEAPATPDAGAVAEPDDEENEEPERGDLVQHFAFGLCEVLIAEGDRLTIRDLSGTSRIREIRIQHLIVEKPTERDGKRVFRLIRRT